MCETLVRRHVHGQESDDSFGRRYFQGVTAVAASSRMGAILSELEKIGNLRKIEAEGDRMRNVIFAINMTIDGCCDHTKVIGDEEIHEHYTQLMGDIDVLVFGRKTYQLMVPFWPEVAKNRSGQTKAMNEFAQAFDSKQIVVFSKSLEKVEGKNTRLVREDLPGEILRLKQEPGRNVLLGGIDIPSQLIALGLVDEYRFVVQPIIAGEGRRLLEGVSLRERLRLVESKTLKSGCVAHRYLKQ
jgi:dihydrofolate reductase